jgi:valyl-tRNA synthetase
LKISDLSQDPDVLDTWFSSWLWPISVFDGIRKPDNSDIKYYYPTDVLVTAPEILFFWVARMIMAGLEYRKEIPFKSVYLTGIVRDKLGRKMSKSLGNSPDPIELMEKYGADGVRVGMLFSSPAGNDLPFDELLCEQGRNFSNKIWNALRLVKGWEIDNDLEQPDSAKVSVEWFGSKLNQTIEVLDDNFDKFRISEALMAVYKLIWDDFCSWYLEMIKPSYQKPIDKKTITQTIGYFEKLMKILHPFMPFITEEIWQLLDERGEHGSIMLTSIPEKDNYDQNILDSFVYVQEVITAVRSVRKDKNIPQKEAINLFVKKNFEQVSDTTFDSVVSKLCNIYSLGYVNEKVENALSFIVKSTEFYIPLSDAIDVESEIKKLEEELKYNKGFLIAVQKKLGNESFVNNAPANVVEIEKKKLTDAVGKIEIIEEQIKMLRSK